MSTNLTTIIIFWSSIALLLIWSLAWKGLALWHSSKRDDRGWFIILLIVNTLGILEIIYLVFIAKIFTKFKVGYSPKKLHAETESKKDHLSEDKKIASIDK